MTITVGSIGFGRHFRRSLLPNLIGTEDLTLLAVAERDPALREQARERFPGLNVVADAAELLALDCLDAVIISTAPAGHVDLARMALESDRHIFVEKPVGTSASAVNDLASLAEERRLVAMAGTMWRHVPAHQVLLEWLRTSEARLQLADIAVTFPSAIERAGWDMNVDELAFYDMFIHPVDWACHLLGRVGRIDAALVPSSDPTRIAVHLRLWSADGSIVASINAATGSHAYQVAEWLHTDCGDLIEVDTNDRLRITTQPTWSGTQGSIRDRATLNWETGQLYRGWARKGYAEELAALAASIRAGKGSAADLHRASETLRVIENCLEQVAPISPPAISLP